MKEKEILFDNYTKQDYQPSTIGAGYSLNYDYIANIDIDWDNVENVFITQQEYDMLPDLIDEANNDNRN